MSSQFISESGAVNALSQPIVWPLHESKPPPCETTFEESFTRVFGTTDRPGCIWLTNS